LARLPVAKTSAESYWPRYIDIADFDCRFRIGHEESVRSFIKRICNLRSKSEKQMSRRKKADCSSVTVTCVQELEVKGPKGILKTPIPAGINFKVDGEELRAERASDDIAALHGLARALANGAIWASPRGSSTDGCRGVGYKVDVSG
jgi:hypothetical protein